MKFICVCQGGNSRSVALAALLKYRYGHDALSCSAEKNSQETLAMLFEWADMIMLMRPHFKECVPEKYHTKVNIVDVGEDRWCNGMHPELHALLISMLEPKKEAEPVANEA